MKATAEYFLITVSFKMQKFGRLKHSPEKLYLFLRMIVVIACISENTIRQKQDTISPRDKGNTPSFLFYRIKLFAQRKQIYHVFKNKLLCPLHNFALRRTYAASMQQRYLVLCYKSGKVQLYLQGSAEAVSHQHCCLLQPAVTLVILCPSSSDRSRGRRPSLRYICLRHMSFANEESLRSLQFPVVCGLY